VFQYTPFQSTFEPVFTGSVLLVDQVDLAGAGFRYFIAERLALGVGVNFGSATTKDEDTGEELSAKSLGVALDVNRHLRSLYGISPYVGGHLDFARAAVSFSPAGAPQQEASATGFGAAVQLGFDWFFTRGLSLGGKYAFGWRHYSAYELKSGGTTTDNGPSVDAIGTAAASVILNVHF
jgi:hypothetical protein